MKDSWRKAKILQVNVVDERSMSDQAGTPMGADSTAEVDETAEMTFAKLTELAFRGGEMALAPAPAVGVASSLVACPLA